MRRFATTSPGFLKTAGWLVIVSAHIGTPLLRDSWAAPQSGSDIPTPGVIQAFVNPKPIRLPIIDRDDLRFVRLSTTQGLSQTRVQQIIQDDEGFIWFGTQYGLDRYDGYKFKVFTHDQTRINSLGGVLIYSMFKDRSGFLWIGSDQTLDRLDPKTETFTHYRLRAPGSDVADAGVSHINQDHGGQLWLATGLGLFRLDPITGNMTRFQHDPSDPFSLSSNDVKSTFEDSHGRFWVANRNGLDEFDRQRGKVILHVPLRDPVREFLVYQDHAGLLWLIYASGGGAGLATYDPQSNVLSHYLFTSEEIPAGAFTGVYAITEDREGALWIGTGGMGLLKLDRTRESFLRYRNLPEDPGSLAEDHITALLTDRQGNIWVGLHSREPNFFSPEPSPFRHLARNLASSSGGEALVSSILQDQRGMLWIGSTSGLHRLDPRTDIATFYGTGGGAVSGGVVSIAQAPSGDLWLGTVGQGLKRFDSRSGSIRTYTHDEANPRSLSDDLVIDLLFDGPNTLWVSTWDGLNRLDTTTGRFTVYKADPRKRERYFKFAEDRDGMLWVGSDFGVSRFNPQTSQFTEFRHSGRPGDISSNFVKSAFLASNGRMWFATQDGLDELNADGTFTSYFERDGLGGNAIGCILEDDAGNLWVSTNKGLSRLEKESLRFTNYSSADGLGDLTGWNTCFKSPGGELFFGGFSGLIKFDPTKIVDLPSQLPIHLTDLKISGRTVQVGPGSPLSKSIVYTDGLTLSHSQSNFTLEFASLDFLHSRDTKYRYKMDGLDSEWNEVGGDQRVVSYTSLPSGSYVFRAQATVRGPWGESETALRIRVLPPWWDAWWFKAAIAVFLVLSVLAAYRYRLREIARQFDIRLEERVRERTRIARELHDSLLQGFQGLMFRLQAVRDLLPGRPDEAVTGLEKALERGDETITDAREAVHDLRSSSLAERDLEHALKALGEEFGSEPHPAFKVIVEGKQRELAPLLRDDIYRVAREAFRNAVRHANAHNIEAEIEYGESDFSLRIRDDGDGIDRDVLARGKRAGHWGLQGMRERAEHIGGRLNVWSERKAGTEIELVIPAASVYGRRGPRSDRANEDDRERQA